MGAANGSRFDFDVAFSLQGDVAFRFDDAAAFSGDMPNVICRLGSTDSVFIGLCVQQDISACVDDKRAVGPAMGDLPVLDIDVAISMQI